MMKIHWSIKRHYFDKNTGYIFNCIRGVESTFKGDIWWKRHLTFLKGKGHFFKWYLKARVRVRAPPAVSELYSTIWLYLNFISPDITDNTSLQQEWPLKQQNCFSTAFERMLVMRTLQNCWTWNRFELFRLPLIQLEVWVVCF